MRNKDGQFVKGSSGNPNGRPTRADEQFLVDLWDEHGKTKFSYAIKNGERWALRALLDKLYPNRKPEAYESPRDNPIPIFAFEAGFTKNIEPPIYGGRSVDSMN